ncbi:MAG: hypothetical protein KAH21_10465, partial [Spirochaetaceae bacterium]|nr:hypothetical protein [Spirochaetaceae bacterium]
MNRYSLWCYFGFLPDVPELTYTGDPDQSISALKDAPSRISLLFLLALGFSRLDSLTEILNSEDWEETAEGLLNRGRLRFYQAVAEKPDSPEPGLLEEAAVDFRRAADHPSTSMEALAGLVRIHALLEDTSAALKHLRRLESIRGGFSCHQAAAGACLFLSQVSGSDEALRRRFLKKARRHIVRSGLGNNIRIVRFLIDDQLSKKDRMRKGLINLSKNGFLDARLVLIQED